MSHRQSDALARRHQQLLVRSAVLRITLAHQAQALKPPLALADQVRAGVQWLRQHPIWPIAALALLALKRPRRILGLTSRLLWGWGLYQRGREWLDSTANKQA